MNDNNFTYDECKTKTDKRLSISKKIEEKNVHHWIWAWKPSFLDKDSKKMKNKFKK